MSPRRAAIPLLVIGGLLLLANPLWLFPHEGDTRYTYERAEIVVENGTLAYHGDDIHDFAEENSLNPVGCQHADERSRACAFDHHLVDHEPVTVAWESRRVTRPDFVRLDGAYYRRLHRLDRSSETRTVTYGVERVTPQTVLAESAVNISDVSASPSDDLRLEFRIAVTGDTVTSFEELGERELGNVYRRNGSYYTVVRTNESRIDRGPDVLRYEVPRYTLAIVGFFLVVGAVVLRTKGGSEEYAP